MIKQIMSVLMLTVFLIGCAGDKKKDTTTAPEGEAYLAAADALDTNPTPANAKTFIRETRIALANSKDIAKNEDYLVKGLTAAETHKMAPAAIGFLMPLLKNYPKTPQREEYLAKLASALQDIGKSIPGDMLTAAYQSRYAGGQYTEALLAKRKETIDDPEKYLMEMAEQIFVDPDQFGINKLSAQKYVDACEAFALGYPDHEKAPDFLYRAAEMARTLKTFPKALGIYQWIGETYPNYEKAATTMFLQGFMLENELNDKAAAKIVYQAFLEKFPNDDLTDDVEFLLENIDKSDEEIMKLIDEKASK